MMHPTAAWAQMNDALNRIQALKAQRAAEVAAAHDSFDRMLSDAADHATKIHAQLDRLVAAHAALIARGDVLDDIAEMIRFAYGEDEA